jgi:uncharacterized membrane protein SpoIIM required for sporulation
LEYKQLLNLSATEVYMTNTNILFFGAYIYTIPNNNMATKHTNLTSSQKQKKQRHKMLSKEKSISENNEYKTHISNNLMPSCVMFDSSLGIITIKNPTFLNRL